MHHSCNSRIGGTSSDECTFRGLIDTADIAQTLHVPGGCQACNTAVTDWALLYNHSFCSRCPHSLQLLPVISTTVLTLAFKFLPLSSGAASLII